MQTSRRGLILSLLTLPLLGCGYQLRGFSQAREGTTQLSYRHIYLMARETDPMIVKSLSQLIRALGAELVDDPSKAELEILLGESQWTQVTSAIGGYGEIAARLVILSQSIQVRQMGTDHWLIDTYVRRSREVDQAASLIAGLGAERPLAITRESVEVTNDVRQRVVDALVRLVQQLAPLNQP